MECAAILDAARVMTGRDDDKTAQARLLLLRIVQMLSKMCRTSDRPRATATCHGHDSIPDAP